MRRASRFRTTALAYRNDRPAGEGVVGPQTIVMICRKNGKTFDIFMLGSPNKSGKTASLLNGPGAHRFPSRRNSMAIVGLCSPLRHKSCRHRTVFYDAGLWGECVGTQTCSMIFVTTHMRSLARSRCGLRKAGHVMCADRQKTTRLQSPAPFNATVD
jgi:hypothetical protein